MSVATVLGNIPSSSMGVTLTHEHLSLDFKKFYLPPPQELVQYFKGEISLQNVGFVKQYPYSSLQNVTFWGPEVDKAVTEDVKLYMKFGGCTIVENTSHGLSRNISFLEKLSKETGVQIIAGTGHYVAGVQTEEELNRTVESIYAIMKTELTEGCINYPSVRCGFIGEVGSSWPIHDFEKRCVKATGQLQEELGCGVSFHPGRHREAPHEILRLYAEAGGNIRRAVMSHLDRTLRTDEELLDFATLGSYCQFDLFGTECSYYQLNTEQDMLSDAQRIDKIICLLEDGKSDRVTVSHDIHTKHRLTSFGGHGYSHLLSNVIPKMSIKGIQKETVDKIMVKNPAEWLSLTK